VGSIEVAVSSIDRLIETGRCPPPHVVKIDVEGAESEVLVGMEATLRDHRPTLIVEVDSPRADRVEDKFQQLCAVLADGGYVVRRLEDGYPGVDWSIIHFIAQPGDGESRTG
jgi:hypothetical protein